MRSLGYALIQHDLGNLGIETDMHRGNTWWRWRQRPGWCITSQGIPGIASKPSEAKGEAWDGHFLPHSNQEDPTCQHIGHGPPASRTKRYHISIVKATQLVVLCHSTLRRLIHLQTATRKPGVWQEGRRQWLNSNWQVFSRCCARYEDVAVKGVSVPALRCLEWWKEAADK